MNRELSDLYQEVILDHYKNPRNRGDLTGRTHEAKGANPLCGDEVSLKATVEGDVISAVKHESIGCAICVASASIMSETASGQPIEAFKKMASAFVSFVRGETDVAPTEKLAVFGGVAEFPMRVKCATLAWHTLEEALKEKK